MHYPRLLTISPASADVTEEGVGIAPNVTRRTTVGTEAALPVAPHAASTDSIVNRCANLSMLWYTV